VGDNAPYVVSDASDYTIPVHAERRGLYHALVEIRQDLIDDEIGQREWALRLGDLLPKAYESLSCAMSKGLRTHALCQKRTSR
jgi:predicted N-formylglutamate amidohydrolase